MFHSIRWRIAIPYVILILLTMLGLVIYLSSATRQSYLDHLKAQLTIAARLISDATSSDLQNSPDPKVIDPLAKHYARLLGIRVTIISPDGTVLGESDENRAQMDNHLTRPEVAQALAQGVGSSIRLSNTLGYSMLYLAVTTNGQPTNSTNQPIAGFVRVAEPLQQVEANIAQLQHAILGALALAAILAVLLATVIARRITRPLCELTEAVEQMSAGALKGQRPAVSLIPHSSDEVGKLTNEFNAMAMRLQTQINALEAEQSKLAAVLQVMTDGVLIVDDQGKVQLLNSATENIFEISQGHALGRSVAETLRHHQIYELWQRCQESGQTQSAILEIGEKRLSLQVAAIPLGQALPGGTLLLFQNLTRMRQLETVRRDFISNISHELRTPLASLKALTETLQDSALDDPPAARHFLQRIEIEVDAMSLMVAELLELSRIESGRVPLLLKPTRPLDILTPAVDRLQLQAERAGLSLTLDCPDSLPLVLADQTRLEQVTVNLLHNAIKFTPEGGQITVRGEQQNDRIVFSVSDTGVGIPVDELPRIFERFYKADRARSSGGTGLGLSISRHLVEAHGGKIWAESISGQGSTFYFDIPLAH
jgi:two-component system phosphate regulon sensor histidine kinase PhoR